MTGQNVLTLIIFLCGWPIYFTCASKFYPHTALSTRCRSLVLHMISEKEVQLISLIVCCVVCLLMQFAAGENQRNDADHGFSPQTILARMAAIRLRICPPHVAFDHNRRLVHVLARSISGVLYLHRLWVCTCRRYVLLRYVQCFQQSHLRFVRCTSAGSVCVSLNRTSQAQCSRSSSALRAPSFKSVYW